MYDHMLYLDQKSGRQHTGHSEWTSGFGYNQKMSQLAEWQEEHLACKNLWYCNQAN